MTSGSTTLVPSAGWLFQVFTVITINNLIKKSNDAGSLSIFLPTFEIMLLVNKITSQWFEGKKQYLIRLGIPGASKKISKDDKLLHKKVFANNAHVTRIIYNNWLIRRKKGRHELLCLILIQTGKKLCCNVYILKLK